MLSYHSKLYMFESTRDVEMFDLQESREQQDTETLNTEDSSVKWNFESDDASRSDSIQPEHPDHYSSEK